MSEPNSNNCHAWQPHFERKQKLDQAEYQISMPNAWSWENYWDQKFMDLYFSLVVFEGFIGG